MNGVARITAIIFEEVDEKRNCSNISFRSDVGMRSPPRACAAAKVLHWAAAAIPHAKEFLDTFRFTLQQVQIHLFIKPRLV